MLKKLKEIKLKHRILGLLVLAALIIIVMPFIDIKKRFHSQTAVVKAPPFPNPTIPDMKNKK